MTELRGRASNRLRAVAIAQVNDACVIKYWVLPVAKESRLAVNCHRFAQKKKAEREEMQNEINKT